MTDTGRNNDHARNVKIARNEAMREAMSAVRLSTWAIGIAIVIGFVIVLLLVRQ